MKTVPCKLCGRLIVWGVSEDGGKRIPLDPRAATYLVVETKDKTIAELDKEGSNVMGDPIKHMVSHFATCPNVGDLKRKA